MTTPNRSSSSIGMGASAARAAQISVRMTMGEYDYGFARSSANWVSPPLAV